MVEKKRILIVEDEAMIAMDMAKFIGDAGYEVTGIVVSGEAAVDQADRDNPDLVLMDIMLAGEIDGREAAMKIRKSHGTPVIFVTAIGNKKQEKVAQRNARTGFGYLVKPFRKTELLSEIKRVLSSTENKCPSVGNARIDVQHRELLDKLNVMIAFLREKYGEQAYINCQKLWKMFEAHCADEEDILLKAGYPHLGDHVALHEKITAQIDRIRSGCQGACRENHVDACIKDIKSTITDHLLSEDMAFAPYLLAKAPVNANH